MTKIEWTDATWNPIAGCSDVSEGCRHCYARTMAGRLEAMGQAKYAGLTVMQGSKRVWTGKIGFDERALLAPLRRKKPTRYFVNSMSDLFHKNVTDEMRDRICAVMALCPQHTFQVLTKRPEVMLGYLTRSVGRLADVIESNRTDKPRRAVGPLPHLNGGEIWFPLANVWLGVSVEDQKTADERIPLLLQTPAAVRFISAEPLLGQIDLTNVNAMVWFAKYMASINPHEAMRQANNDNFPKYCPMDVLTGKCVAVEPDLQENIDWVIVGGESGSGARPMHPDWARSLRDQCKAAGVPFFFKQWGDWVPWQPDGGYSEWKSQAGQLMDRHAIPDLYNNPPANWTDAVIYEGDEMAIHQRVGKKAAGALLDGVSYREIPVVSR